MKPMAKEINGSVPIICQKDALIHFFVDFSCGACSNGTLPDLRRAMRNKALTKITLTNIDNGNLHIFEVDEEKTQKVK